MRVCAVQTTNHCGDSKVSFAAAERLIAQAAKEGAELAVLPELSTCGYIPNDQLWHFAEPLDGPTAAWACEVAPRFGLHVGAGFLETDGHDFFNSYLVAAPNGTVAGRVRKMKVEPHVFAPSDVGSVIDTALGRLAVGICADNHVASFYERLANLDFDLMLMPHAWTMPYRTGGALKEEDLAAAASKINVLCRTYAGGFGVPVVFANPVGETEAMRGVFGRLTPPSTFRLRGGSGIFLPDDSSVRLEEEREGIVIADVTPGRTREVPAQPTTYDGWLHPGSAFCRRVLAPLDNACGRRHYRTQHNQALPVH